MKPYLGVIEGFFGREWSFEERYGYADFLQRNGYRFYIYAPKSDAILRKSWRQDWPADTATRLAALAGRYQGLGLDFGLGLSPFEIYKNYDSSARKSLLQKINRLNALGIDILCLLFDDMRGDQTDLAELQVRITQDVLAYTSAKRVIMCPTYYSFTPQLENLFGAMPEHYFEDLGEGLPDEVDIFWTGPEICSREYPQHHLEQVNELLRRKPFLWDNYPVNDGADISRFLHLKAFEDRPHTLAGLTSGHAVNPMNQPWLSRIPLYTLPRSYAQGAAYDPDEVLQEALQELCSHFTLGPGDSDLAQELASDLDTFQTLGLNRLERERREELIERYTRFDSPYSQEIVAWLRDEYSIDQDCLTG